MRFSLLPAPDETRLPRWYFGGIAATFAQVFIYPIEVVKIGLQTEQIMEKITVYRYAKYLLDTQGLRRLYSGLPISLRQQFLHSTTRFGLYYKIKEQLQMKEVPFIVDLVLSAGSGAVGALVKNPLEIINTRMLIDYKLSPIKRHNYKNVRHAVQLIKLTEGYRGLFIGVQLNVMKSIAFTCGQICMYVNSKSYIRRKYDLNDTMGTHVIASALAGLVATIVCQPIEVVKVRYMSQSDEFSSVWQVFEKQIQLGMLGFYRGTLLTFLRVEIQTIITFVLIEQMRLYFGLMPSICTDENEALIRDCIVVKKEEVIPKPSYFHTILHLTHYVTAPLISGISWILKWIPLIGKQSPVEPSAEEESEEAKPPMTPIPGAKDRLVNRVVIVGKLFYRLGAHISEKVFKQIEEEMETAEEEKHRVVIEETHDVEEKLEETIVETVDGEDAIRKEFQKRDHIHDKP